MPATMTPHDWARIVARAQEAHWLRRWAGFRREAGDGFAALRLEVRAARAEAVVMTIARGAGAAL